MTPQSFKRCGLAALAMTALALPLILRSPTYLHILIMLYLYAYMTTTWNLVGGFAGVLPLGHALHQTICRWTSSCTRQEGSYSRPNRSPVPSIGTPAR